MNATQTTSLSLNYLHQYFTLYNSNKFSKETYYVGLVIVNTKRKKTVKKGTKKVVAVKLPKHVRDKLRMAYALKGYSIIKYGKGKN